MVHLDMTGLKNPLSRRKSGFESPWGRQHFRHFQAFGSSVGGISVSFRD
jgi:hypothetical protein